MESEQLRAEVDIMRYWRSPEGMRRRAEIVAAHKATDRAAIERNERPDARRWLLVVLRRILRARV